MIQIVTPAVVILVFCSWNAMAAEELLMAPQECLSMQRLFNGHDLTDWDGDPRLWSVKNGALRGETSDEHRANGNTFIIWKGGFVGDFELRLSFRCNATNNSGIQYRSKQILHDAPNNWVVRGYQHELRNENVFPNVSGFIYDEGGTRNRICLVGERANWTGGRNVVEANLLGQEAFQRLFKLDDWNDVVILAEGHHIQHFLNDALILDFTDQDPELALKNGVLALQLHAGKPMWVEFKHIRMREIP
ncbi:MAG: DUF1080 domain-containing protein [Planctomycetales bacterium]|nr:DUF1080 domain-containing protein [Planctomycetales bacterium]